MLKQEVIRMIGRKKEGIIKEIRPLPDESPGMLRLIKERIYECYTL